MPCSMPHHTVYYSEDQIVSDTHYTLGSGLHMTNIDCLEYKWHQGKRVRVAIIDYKYPGQALSTQYDAIQVQAELAHDLQLPFFFVITYLEPTRFPVPMYYVIPINQMATIVLPDLIGSWMSLQQYSRWLHQIRKIEIPHKDIDSVNKLSNQVQKYTLPNLSGIEILP
jgi:hypothetical protein